ncbi:MULTISPECIES: hypothetical protein [unclassified Arsukibacterium]|uniref:hypothetical protein n=1 Tax=unclassified Arsukibacterium TaxID=2635278 RepID=UPI000C3E3605|nr:MULTISPECIES: hypothetical protein [unclassified Arsukibacterium]MBM33525.1 hypothetical protein [Rheinheimera sp.]|tara:strand:- start:1063 stop:1830 length:768 start_codon:yes stop_codon:yes gene_type:complete
MSNQKEQMKWVLFWVFLTLFVLMVLGTLAMVFLGFGSPTESERELMVKGLIGEVAVCIIALFYSIFGLKSGSVDASKLQELENKTDQALSIIESLRLSNDKNRVGIVSDSSEQGGNSFSVGVIRSTFQEKIAVLDLNPPFPVSDYELTPLPIEIKNDIRSAKPMDVKHKESTYKGMKVQWRALLASVEMSDENKVFVTAELDESILWVWFELEKSSNNTLLVADKDEPFWLCGEIVEATSHKIKMSNVQIKFKKT